MKVRDYYVLGRRSRVRLHEKGGKEHEVPCHHNLEKYLDDCLLGRGRLSIKVSARARLALHIFS